MKNGQGHAALNGVGPDAVDLGALRRSNASPEMQRAAQEEGEVRAGLRCAGCRQRVTSGFRVHGILVALIGGQGAIEHVVQTACPPGGDCGFILELLKDERTVAIEPVKYRFTDDDLTRAALGLPPKDPTPEPSAPVEPEPVVA